MLLLVCVVLFSGCTSVAYVENGANGSECENTVSINETGERMNVGSKDFN